MASDPERPDAETATGPDPVERQEIVVNAYASRPSGAPAAAPAPRSDSGARENRPRNAPVLSWVTLLICGVLALVLGAVGAWAYHTFLAKPAESKEGGGSQERLALKNNRSVMRLDAEVGRLSDQVEQLAKRLKAMPEPAPPPDLKPLQARIAKLDEVAEKIESLSDTLSPLPGRVNEDRDRLKAVEESLREVKAGLEGLRNELNTAREDAEEAKDKPQGDPSDESAGKTPDAAFERGVNLFHKREYEEARELFLKLTRSEPDDARVWYYAALANGFATGEWRSETERLVRQGVERERAKTPPRFMIDAAFANLKDETGRAWLDVYRKRSY